MSASLALATSSWTLFHVSLAHFTDEIHTLDDIIARRSHSHSTDSLPKFPVEILLPIRAYLLSEITNHLIDQSYSALHRYETALRHLLCTECLSYNERVYGYDLWKWEQFSGACRCTEQGLVASQSLTIARAASLTLTPSLNPRQFLDRRQWLEYYLSRKSLRFVSRHPLDQHSRPSQHSIWNLVGSVLQHFDCVGVHQTTFLAPAPSPGRAEGSDILIVPVPDVRSSEKNTLPDEVTSKIKLRRVERDLALTIAHVPPAPPEHSASLPVASPPSKTPSPTSSSCPLSLKGLSCMLRSVANRIEAFDAVLVTTITIPVSLVTLVFTGRHPRLFLL